MKVLLPGRDRWAVQGVLAGGAPACLCLQGGSAHEGGAERLILLTRSKVGLDSEQLIMASLEVCLRRKTLR